jgi:DNA-binding MarR family transcriptional regulator
LLSQTGARTAQLFEARLAPLGVSPRAFGVMSNLATHEGTTQQGLADALGMHRNNMVGLIDEMEAAGWVRRHRSTEDRRAFQLRLTTAGRALVAQVNGLIPGLDSMLSAKLGAAERRELAALLKRVAEALDLSPAVHPHLAGRPRQPSSPSPGARHTGPR